MSTPFAFTDPEERRDLAGRDVTGVSDDLKLFARLEGLVREELALLAIPAAERHQEHKDRLHAVTGELDRIAARLHERAERLGLARS